MTLPPFQAHSATSREAAIEIYPKAGTLRASVYEALAQAGDAGLTDEQIGQQIRMGGNTVRPRRVELVEKGLVRDSGRRRETGSGRKAVVWVCASTGGAAA